MQFYPPQASSGASARESNCIDGCARLELAVVAEVDEHYGALPIPKMDILDDIGEYLDINDKRADG